MNVDTARKAMLGAAAVTALGVFLPWVTAVIVSLNGIDADRGQFALAITGVGALVVYLRLPRVVQLVPPAAVAALAIWFYADVASMPAGPFGVHATPGSGVYVTTLGAIAWFVIACAARTSPHARAITPVEPATTEG